MVNYIFHELTDHDKQWMDLMGRVGRFDAYIAYRKILDKIIAKLYPELAETAKEITDSKIGY